MALYVNNYNRDEDDAQRIAEYLAQRERLVTVRVLEADVMTVEELEQVLDYESDIEDRLDWARGSW